MKKLSILFAAVALLAACSQKEDVIPQLDENAIQFSAYSSASVVTRGVVQDASGFNASGIGVFAFYQPKATGKFNTYKYATPDFMYNQQVTSTDGDTWTYEPVKYWPNNEGDMVSFFAYAPYSADKAWEDMGVKTDVKAKKLTTSFVINQDVVDQEDYLFATPQLNRTKQAVDANGNKYTTGTNNIKFDFKHITSQVNLYVGVEQNTASQTPTVWNDANTTIEVQSIEFKGLSSSMIYTYSIDESGSVSSDPTIVPAKVKQDVTLTEENFTSNKTINDEAPWTTAGFYQLNKDNSVMFLAPEKLGKVVITYTVTTLDGDINNANSSVVTNVIESDMSNVTLEAGKSYKMNFLIGMNSVKIVAALTDWATPAIEKQVDVPANEVHGVCFEAKTAPSTVSMATTGTAPEVSLVYSTDNMKTWQEFSVGSTTISLNNIGDKVYFRAKDGVTNNTFANESAINVFTATGDLKVSGNIMYLLNGTTPPSNLTTGTNDLCFTGLFMACDISDASGLLLPATTLSKACYYNMFAGCTGLTTAPVLPATELADLCYSAMFAYSGLTTAPVLPATTLAEDCYQSMFEHCEALTTAPALPATELKKYCYANMFEECTGLTTAPALNATTLADSCYSAMFVDCTSLIDAPTLPATTLADYCYLYMFKGCEALKTAPALNATKLKKECYQEMFNGCTNLGSVTMLATDVSANNCLDNWLQNAGTSATPKIVHNNKSAAKEVKIAIAGKLPSEWALEYPAIDGLCFEAKKAGAKVSMATHGDALSVSLEYYTDNGSTWSDFIVGNTIITLDNIGDKVYFRAKSPNAAFATENTYNYFTTDGDVEVSGNIMYLLNGTTPPENLVTYGDNDFCFASLFSGCTTISDASGLLLPANELSMSCYSFMFGGCTSLKTAPALPAMTLADYCYMRMFSGCTHLTAAPELNALTLAERCYDSMFNGCEALTTAPELNAETLKDRCYQNMFSGCTNLETAPTLSSTTLDKSCYNGMFSGCTGLTAAPELNASDLKESCYAGMFSGCTGLTAAPDLNAQVLKKNCYKQMFENCTGLTTAPALSAETLDECCCEKMFNGCIELTTAPELSATTLAAYCYDHMFYGCSKLGSVTMLATNVSADDCLYYWLGDPDESDTQAGKDAASRTVTVANDAAKTAVEGTVLGFTNIWTVNKVTP